MNAYLEIKFVIKMDETFINFRKNGLREVHKILERNKNRTKWILHQLRLLNTIQNGFQRKIKYQNFICHWQNSKRMDMNVLLI